MRSLGTCPARGKQRHAGSVSPGFSLLELLTVVALIGVLAALLIPGLGAARTAANRGRTKVQFQQWISAVEAFRAEYGHYPVLDASHLVNGGAGSAVSSDHPFHDLLAGRKRDGTAAANASALSAGSQNHRRIAFHAFTDSEFAPADTPAAGLLCDAFGNTSIAVLVDRNLDGVLNVGSEASDYPELPAVQAPDGTMIRPAVGGAGEDFPVTGLRTTVVFYTADPLATAQRPRFILSWK